MDWHLFNFINRFAERTTWAHGLMAFLADLGVAVFMLFLAVAAALAVRRSDARLLAGTASAAGGALVALAANQPIANLVDRARPYTAHPSVLTLVHRGSDPSFMSDHAIVAASVAAGLLLVTRRLGIAAAVAAIAMAFDRVYVGAHYPGDVLAGIIFGSVIAWVVVRVVRRPAHAAAHFALARRPLKSFGSPSS